MWPSSAGMDGVGWVMWVGLGVLLTHIANALLCSPALPCAVSQLMPLELIDKCIGSKYAATCLLPAPGYFNVAR